MAEPTDAGEELLIRRKRSRSVLKRLSHRLRRGIRRAGWPLLVLGTVAVLALGVVGALVIATDASTRVESAWKTLDRMLQTLAATPGSDLTLDDFERLQLGLEGLSGSLSAARRQTGFLRVFGGLNGDLGLTFQLLDAADELARAATNIVAGLEPTLFFLTSGSEDLSVVMQVSSGERVVELLRLGRSRFLAASEQLAAAGAVLGRLSLAQASSNLLLTAEDLDDFYVQIRDLNAVLLQAPDLLTVALGLDEEQVYLVLSQNNDEIRPSGGYLSTYGWLRVRNARITEHDYQPTTPTSPTPPPAAFAETFAIPEWWFAFDDPVYAAWDGSWYPAFPATAELAARYYDAGQNPHSPVDGVIGIDITGFEYILEGLGKVTVPGYAEDVTAENFRQIVYRIREEGDATLAHKRFLAALYRQILADWRTIDRERGVELVGAALRGLQEKHIMLYFRDEALNAAVATLGWSGDQAPGDYDYLLVADANLSNKSNHSIVRQLTYDVAIQTDGTLNSRLTVSYDYSAQLAGQDPAVNPAHYGQIDYYNLLQVFVPPGSALTATDNLGHAPTQSDSESFSTFIELVQVEYDTGERIQFSYVTPPLIEEFGQYRRYRLLVQKQPGMAGEMVSVQVSLPEGAEVVSTSPEEAASYMLGQPVLEFQMALTTDQWVEVIYTE